MVALLFYPLPIEYHFRQRRFFTSHHLAAIHTELAPWEIAATSQCSQMMVAEEYNLNGDLACTVGKEVNQGV